MSAHMQVAVALKRKVEARIAECKKMTGIDVGKVDIRYDINSQRLGGQAIYRGNVIRLNPVFLNAHTDHYILTTVAHEYAHLAAYHKYGASGHGHGIKWKNVFAMTGSPVSRCHSYTVPDAIKDKVGKKVQKHEASCSRCGEKFQVGPKVHAKMAKGSTYKHNRCGGVVGLTKADGYVRVVPRVTTPAAPKAATGSKLDICRAIYLADWKVGRDHCVYRFITEAKCTAAGASTYWAKLKKENG